MITARATHDGNVRLVRGSEAGGETYYMLPADEAERLAVDLQAAVRNARQIADRKRAPVRIGVAA